MDEQNPEEVQGQIPVTEASQLPEEVKYDVPAASPAPEEVKPEVIGAAQPPEDRASGMAISAMVVGIVGILCSWVIVFNFALGVTALVLGIVELKRIKDGAANKKGNGMALTGVILGSLVILGALVYVIVMAVLAVSFTTGMSSMIPSLMKQFGGNFY